MISEGLTKERPIAIKLQGKTLIFIKSLTHIRTNGVQQMSTTKIDINTESKKRLIVLVARKYGKTKGVLGKEATEAINQHCKKLEEELGVTS